MSLEVIKLVNIQTNEEEIPTITVADLRAYIASREPGIACAWPDNRNNCLVAQTLRWKYASAMGVSVISHWEPEESNTVARIGSMVIEIPVDVKLIADKFDRLSYQEDDIEYYSMYHFDGMTKEQLLKEFPELQPEGVRYATSL